MIYILWKSNKCNNKYYSGIINFISRKCLILIFINKTKKSFSTCVCEPSCATCSDEKCEISLALKIDYPTMGNVWKCDFSQYSDGNLYVKLVDEIVFQIIIKNLHTQQSQRAM